MEIGDRVHGVSCRLGGGTIQGTVVLIKENTMVVSTSSGNELIKKEGAEKLGYKITKLLINEFLKDKGYKKGTWELYQKHLTKFMEITAGDINPETVMKAQKVIADTLSEASKKQALGALKKYLEWLGYYDHEFSTPIGESLSVSKKAAPNQFNPSNVKPDISKEERERKAKEMVEKIKQIGRTESFSADEKVSLPRETKQEETILDRDTATLVMIGKAFVRICSSEKEIHLTKDFKTASEVNELQAEVIIDEFGGRKVQVETKYILHYQ